MEVRRSLLVSVTVAVLVCCTGPRLAEALGASTVSLSGKFTKRSCFRLRRYYLRLLVHERPLVPSLSAAIVTQLVTHL